MAQGLQPQNAFAHFNDPFPGIPLPPPEEVVKHFVKITELLNEACNAITEEGLSNGIEATVSHLVHMLERLADNLPASPHEYESAAAVLIAYTEQNSDEPPAITKEELKASMQAAAAVLASLQVALRDISREDIGEIVEVGLPLTCAAAATLESFALRLQRNLARLEQGSSVVIEDLDAASSDGSTARRRICGGPPCHITICRRRRYLWRPLWPRIQKNAWPILRDEVSARARAKPVWAAVLAACCGPSAVCAVVWIAPPTLMADAALQRAYAWKGPEAEDVVDGALQMGRLAYRTTRLVARQSLRVARAQAQRVLNGRSPPDLLRECWHDPRGSVRELASHAADGVQWACHTLPVVTAWVPTLLTSLKGSAVQTMTRTN